MTSIFEVLEFKKSSVFAVLVPKLFGIFAVNVYRFTSMKFWHLNIFYCGKHFDRGRSNVGVSWKKSYKDQAIVITVYLRDYLSYYSGIARQLYFVIYFIYIWLNLAKSTNVTYVNASSVHIVTDKCYFSCCMLKAFSKTGDS